MSPAHDAWMLSRHFGRCVAALGFGLQVMAQNVADHEVVWRTPSPTASGSMPIGNGEIGCNVWCPRRGTVSMYVARTDSFSEASRLLKLGEISLTIEPVPKGTAFEQRLVLAEGRIQISVGDGDDRVVLNVFADSDSDVVHVTSDSKQPHMLSGSARSWRTEAKRLRGEELQSSWTMKDAPEDLVVSESADVSIDIAGPVAAAQDDERRHLGWLHHNRDSVVALTAKRQGLPVEAVADPLRNRAFGLMTQPVTWSVVSQTPAGFKTWVHEQAKHHELRIAAACLQVDKPEQWTAHAKALLAATDSKTAQQRTAAWWRAFWARSWVFVHGDEPAASGVPQNAHPLRIGVDSGGGNRFVGTIARVAISGDPTNAASAPLFTAEPGTKLPLVTEAARDLDLRRGLRITANVLQHPEHPIGRIVDKVTAGSGDGFLFDTHPGYSLRLIVGDRQLVAQGSLQSGKAHDVAASFDAATGRMWIECDGKVVADSENDPARPWDGRPASGITQALILQRWVQACGGRGQFPIKFNGSIFTVEPNATGGQPHDADWRRWGDCFWWQNTRLPYYPMLAQGDFTMQAPLFRLYRTTLAVAFARAQAWHGVTGAYWPETMTPFGTHANGDYGWQRDGVPSSKVLCPWWEYARNQGLELLALLLDRYDHERDDVFWKEQVLPIAVPVLQWFSNAYPRAADGALRITPTQSLETHWHKVENDLPTVAGLHWCLRGLRTLAPQLVPQDQLREWLALERALPPIPVHTVQGEKRLSPAGTYDPSRQNCESPELYAVFPFRLYGLGKPDLELARAAYRARHDRFTNGWPQDGQQAALLGFVDDARSNVLAKVKNHNAAHRFPVMWGPNFDWCPDQCHGSNLLDTVHRMLLQCDDGKLRVLPCWPKEWDVSFRLHAPQRTVVECVFRGGRVERCTVTPASRQADVVLPQ